MRSLLLGLLAGAVITVVLGPTAAAVPAAKTLEWKRYKQGKLSLETPKGWFWEVSDKGATVWITENKSAKTRMSVGLLRRRAKPKDHAVALAKLYAKDNGYTSSPHVDDYVVGGADFATVFATDRWATWPARVGVRVEIDRDAGVVEIGVVRAGQREFRKHYGWRVLDRIMASRKADGSRIPSYRDWDWTTYQDDDVALMVPKDWNVEVTSKKGGFIIQVFDGPTINESVIALIFMRIPAPANERKRTAAVDNVMSKLFPDARRINHSELVFVPLWKNRDGEREYRIASQVDSSPQYVTVATALGEPDAFWRADLPELVRTLSGSIGLGNDQLPGLWMGGAAGNTLLHYDAAGHFITSTSEENGLLIAFDDDGTYEMRYLYSNSYYVTNNVWSEDAGRYTFDGLNLELQPTRRVVYSQVGSKAKVTRQTFKAKDLPTVTATVRIDPLYAGVIEVSGPGFQYAGHLPGFEKAMMTQAYRRITMSRIETDKKTSGFKNRNRRKAAKK